MSSEQLPKHELEPDSPHPTNIIIEYDGTLAPRLSWNLEAFDKASEDFNIKSTIYIRNKRTQDRYRSYSNLGNTILQSKVPPLNMWHEKRKRDFDMIPNYRTGDISLFIHDDLVAEKAKEQPTRFEQAFTAELEKTVRDGVASAIRAEKIDQAWGGLIITGSNAVSFIGGSVIAKEVLEKAYDRPDDFTTLVQGVLGIGIGTGIVVTTAYLTREIARLMTQLEVFPYHNQWSDFSPVKPLQKWLEAYSLSKPQPTPWISLKESSAI